MKNTPSGSGEKCKIMHISKEPYSYSLANCKSLVILKNIARFLDLKNLGDFTEYGFVILVKK